MNALVTGANGFTGSFLSRLLLKKGYRVRVLVRNESNTESLTGLDIEYIRKDLARDPIAPEDLDGIDIVFHVAAAFRVENVPRQHFWDVNVEGTRRLLDAADKAKVKRFVHCSTVGVQGEIKTPPAKEEDPYNPGDYYQESKVDGEKLVIAFQKSSKMEITIVRPVGIYGPGDMRFLKLFKAINNRSFRMIGTGKVLYHLTYVEDLVEGIFLAGVKPEAVGQIFTIGGSGFVTLSELVLTISQILNRPVSRIRFPVWPVWLLGYIFEIVFRPFGITPPIYRRRVDFFIKDRAFDISKARTLLGYDPKVQLHDGLKKTADWYLAQKLI